ncbi:hypothetical protein MHYP_G00027480 [Metynnis hypsauchen]
MNCHVPSGWATVTVDSVSTRAVHGTPPVLMVMWQTSDRYGQLTSPSQMFQLAHTQHWQPCATGCMANPRISSAHALVTLDSSTALLARLAIFVHR